MALQFSARRNASMKMVIFGLTISSSWGNGHATLWRGLTGALIRRGWDIVFFERDIPYYRNTRDLNEIAGGELVFYAAWADIVSRARQELNGADVAIVTSYCPDGVSAGSLVASSNVSRRIFYDLDTPVTLAEIARGERPAYIGPQGFSEFDLVLSFTGGIALEALLERLGACRALALYGQADPTLHCAAPARDRFRGDLSYLGTYSADRQESVQEFIVAAARRRKSQRFVIGGAQYPADFPWEPNVFFVRHLPPGDHASFFCSSRLTLNITRRAMAKMGWCPSGRLFEAAACGTPIVSDYWQGLEDFFEPGREILVAYETDDVLDALDRGPDELAKMGNRARERVLTQHTSEHRAMELENILYDTADRSQSN
jgi:spore maturation protein CgeB